jgi:hypothetical protein
MKESITFNLQCPQAKKRGRRSSTETPLVSPNYRNHRTWQFEEARALSLTK